jgi:hypothetical protein
MVLPLSLVKAPIPVDMASGQALWLLHQGAP